MTLFKIKWKKENCHYVENGNQIFSKVGQVATVGKEIIEQFKFSSAYEIIDVFGNEEPPSTDDDTSTNPPAPQTPPAVEPPPAETGEIQSVGDLFDEGEVKTEPEAKTEEKSEEPEVKAEDSKGKKKAK